MEDARKKHDYYDINLLGEPRQKQRIKIYLRLVKSHRKKQNACKTEEGKAIHMVIS